MPRATCPRPGRWTLPALVLLALLAALPTRAQEPAASPRPAPRFEVPDPRPPLAKHWLDRPFLFGLAGTGRLPSSERERQARERLDRIVQESGAEAREAWVDQELGVTAVLVGDEVLLTVLPEDMPEYYAQAPPEVQRDMERQLAEKWRVLVEAELQFQAGIRSSESQSQAWLFLGILTGIAIVVHLFVHRAALRFFRSPAWSVKALIWTLWLVGALVLFPAGQDTAALVEQTLLDPLMVLVPVWVAGLALYALAAFLVRRYLEILSRLRGDVGERAERRRHTLQEGVLFLIRFALVVVGAGVVLNGAGVNLGFLFTGAGLIGLMIGWIGKDLFQDLIHGANILLEDHYGVGDDIEAGPVKGVVEAFTLRSTWVRSLDGGLTTVPNSDMRRTVNYSREWCQADVRVTVPFGPRLLRSGDVLREEAEALARERPDLVSGAPQFLGVEDLGKDTATFRVLLRTPPGRHREVQRELQGRVARRLQEQEEAPPPPVVFVE